MAPGLTGNGPIPPRAGVGLKPEHYRDILKDAPEIGWFEIHAENYMGEGGPPHAHLTAIRERYPLSLHGVGLSIGGSGPLDKPHLARLKALVDRYQPALFSEHLAWSSHDRVYLNDLLPLPYTEETLATVCAHIEEVQETLQRRMLLENPSTYVAFAERSMSEIEFLSEVVRRTGCGLLLDVNNVFVQAANHGFTASAYLDDFPVEHVGEIHLGGHAQDTDDDGAALLIDDHGREVADPVWALYARALSRTGEKPTLIEWDNDVPSWPVLFAEAEAGRCRHRRPVQRLRRGARVKPAAAEIEGEFARAVLDPDAEVPAPLAARLGGTTSGTKLTRRFGVYRNNVYGSLIEALSGHFPVTARLVGFEFFDAMARVYIETEPPRSPVLIHYGASFADFVAAFPPAGAVPYLADVARLEWAWHAAYHAPDATALSVAALREAAPNAEIATLMLHPSLAVVGSPYPVVTIWQTAAAEGKDEPAQLPANGPARLPANGEDALVIRAKLDVEVRRLPEGGAAFVRALQGGATLQVAADRAMQDVPGFDLAANLAGLIASGVIVGVC